MGAESPSAEKNVDASGGIVGLTLQRLFQRIAEADEKGATDISSTGDRYVRAPIRPPHCTLFDIRCIYLFFL